MYRNPHKAPSKKRRPTNASVLPTEPGWYVWSEWQRPVELYRKPGGRHLYVTPPGGVEVRVSPYIAGTFTPLESKS